MAGGTRARPAAVALGASVILNAVFLACYFSRHPSPSELLGKPGAAGVLLAQSGSEGTTKLADMYTAPLHLMKSLIDNALQGAGYTKPKQPVDTRMKSVPLADSNAASMNNDLTEHRVVQSTGAFFDPSIKAFINPLLLPDLKEMNELQAKVFAHKLYMLKSADKQIANPTSGGKPHPLKVPESKGLFQWGTVNPVSNVIRLDCTDSVMDASSNGAPMNRLWGSHGANVDDCGPGDECAAVDACGPDDSCRDTCAYTSCNEGHKYTVECPPGCAARSGPVFGGGSRSNPFMDASSVCGAALAQGIARDDAPTLLTLTIVPPVAKYRGAKHTTFDFEWPEWENGGGVSRSGVAGEGGSGSSGTSKLGAHAARMHTAEAKYRQKWGGRSWFGVRAFTLENLVTVPLSPARGGGHALGGGLRLFRHPLHNADHMGAPYAPRKWNQAHLDTLQLGEVPETVGEFAAAGGLAQWESLEAREEKVAETFAGKDSAGLTKLVDVPMAQSQMHMQFLGGQGDVAVAERGALVFNDGIWNSLTVECWVKDLEMREISSYVGAYNSDPRFGAKHYGFILGTYKKQFAFGVGAGDNTEMDYVMAPDWLTLPNQGKWTHLAGTYDAEGGMKLYINGLFVGCSHSVSGPVEFPSQGAPAGAVDVVMGGIRGGQTDPVTGANSEGTFMKGAIDEVRIWSVVREQEEIFDMMHRTVRDEFLEPTPDGLELYWRFDFDVVNCLQRVPWIPCRVTCDEVRQYPAHMDTAAGEAPSDKCFDMPDFLDNEGDSCATWAAHPTWCSGSPEDGVVDMPSDYKNEFGVDPATACCVCGGGFRGKGGGVDLVKSDVPCEALTLARGCNHCPPYPPVEYGSVEPSGPLVTFDHVKITCDDGFKPKVNDTAQLGTDEPECQFDMSYTPGVVCVAICKALDAPEHGELEPAGQVEMFQWVTLNCNPGYEPVGNRYVMCRPDHEYLYAHGFCMATCNPYPAVDHGAVSMPKPYATPYSEVFGDAHHRAGDVLQVECEATFALSYDSSAKVTCGEGGEYDYPTATCLPACPPHPRVLHGVVSVTGQTILGDEIQISCAEDYALQNAAMSAVVCQSNHELSQPWLGKPPSHTGDYSLCLAVCKALEAPAHGKLEPSGDVLEGDAVTLKCDSGYEPVGTEEVTCQKSHSYGGKHGFCVPICKPYTVTNGAVSVAKGGLFADGHHRAGDVLKVECNAGFVLAFDASPVVKCDEFGEYDYPNPGTCVPICAAHPAVANGVVSVTGPTFLGDTVEITCKDKYVLEKPEMAAVVCQPNHDLSQPWLKSAAGKHTGQYSRCIAVCPPYPYVDYSTITVDGSWEKASDPVREGSVIQVKCNAGTTPGPYNGGSPTARCVDSSTGTGGVYDPPVCQPEGGLNPKPYVGYTACTPARCIAPPPPPPPPPPPVPTLQAPKQPGDPSTGWGLNIKCSDFRDQAFVWSMDKQVDYLSLCMSQDCAQSLEGGNANAPTELGCRFMDANGFCYNSGTTQMWCKDNAGDSRCVDGGQATAMPPLGTSATKPPQPTMWQPVANYPLRGTAKETGLKVSCSCMKNCACVVQNKDNKCYCSKLDTEVTGAGPWKAATISKAGKDGECFCKCVAGDAVAISPIQPPPPPTKPPAPLTQPPPSAGVAAPPPVVTIPVVSIAPPPPVLPPVVTIPPPPPADAITIKDAVGAALCVQDSKYPNECKSLLNIRCADWRDLADSFAPTKQEVYYAGCMAQDCAQSMEGGNLNKQDEPGCRFLDYNGFCYIYGTAQMWCAGRGKGTVWCKDGGQTWGLQINGLGTSPSGAVAPGQAVGAFFPPDWTPHAGVAYRGQWKDSGYNGNKAFSCSCMKNCGCVGGTKCFCVDDKQKETGPGKFYGLDGPFKDSKSFMIIKNSGKRGGCSCTCGVGAAAQSS